MQTLLSIVIVLAATSGWLVCLYRLDRNVRDKQSGHVIAVMVFGGAASVLPAWFAYEANPFFHVRLGGWFAYEFFVVGLTEESIKFLAFIAIAQAMKSIREPQDGIIQGAAVGVGFSALEDIMYGAQFGARVALLRSVLLGLHALAGAIWGFAWSRARYLNVGARNRGAYAVAGLALLPAALIHALYNTIWDITERFDQGAVGTVTLCLAVFCGVVLVFRAMSANSPYYRYSYDRAGEAIFSIHKGMQINPRSRVLHRRMAVYALAAGNYHVAAERFRYCLKFTPNSAMLRAFLGVALMAGDEKIDGESMFRGAIAELPKVRCKQLDAELNSIVLDETLQRRIQCLLHPPEELLDQWMRRRKELGMWQ